jgi:hypothetical protein
LERKTDASFGFAGDTPDDGEADFEDNHDEPVYGNEELFRSDYSAAEGKRKIRKRKKEKEGIEFIRRTTGR